VTQNIFTLVTIAWRPTGYQADKAVNSLMNSHKM